MNEDDFVYYKDENDKVYSGGFTVNSLALKSGLSPLFGGGGENDTEFSQQFKNQIVPSFLHYQLAGDNDNYSEKMMDLLNTYNDEEQSGGDLFNQRGDLFNQKGDLFNQLNDFEHFLGLSIVKKKNKKFSRKGRTTSTNQKNTKKNRK